ncbi:MAG TPA: hypothetical protein VHW74_14040 [Mycobacteriales bacterium]|jgi:hypothetical protein|nr:hypothetical protein [Mycobacteriales bacterium]
MRSTAPLAGLLVAAAISMATSTSASSATSVPVLGIPQSFGAHSQGWGHVRPNHLYNASDGSGDITLITWSSWGSTTAQGIGKNSIFKPAGGYYRQPVRIQLRATDVGPCGATGQPGYHHLYVREPSRPGGPYGKWRVWTSYHRDLCTKFN